VPAESPANRTTARHGRPKAKDKTQRKGAKAQRRKGLLHDQSVCLCASAMKPSTKF